MHARNHGEDNELEDEEDDEDDKDDSSDQGRVVENKIAQNRWIEEAV